MGTETIAPKRPDAILGDARELTEKGTCLKTCPFCAEQIQIDAIKCRYCHEFLNGTIGSAKGPAAGKWYHGNGSLATSFLFLGPLALPLLWVNPRFKRSTKALLSLVVVAVTYYCIRTMMAAFQRVSEQLDMLGTF